MVNENKYPLLKNNNMYWNNIEKSYPIAEDIVSLLSEKKISYAEACEALDIAKEGIKTLRIGT
jgi:hypothetical protein